MLQFSLRNLLVAVAVVAIGITALLGCNDWWSASLWGVALLTLVFAGLMVLFRRGAERAFWSGYLLAGFLYVLLLLRSAPNLNEYTHYTPLTHDHLITTRLIVRAYFLFPDEKTSQFVSAPGGISAPGNPPGLIPNPKYLDIEAFKGIGHALWTLFLSWLGGTVGYWAYRTRGKPSTEVEQSP